MQIFFTWGTNAENEVEIINAARKQETTIISLRHSNQYFEIEIPFIDEASIQNALTCIAVLFF